MNQMQTSQTPNTPPVAPPPPEPHYRFRWTLVMVVLVILGFFWLRDGVEMSFRFQDVLDYLRIRHEDKYVQVACLAIALIAVTLIARILRRDSK
jgi:hypothetical protein